MTIEISVTPALSRTMQGEAMLPAEEVMSMVRLHQCGWGAKRIRQGIRLRAQYGSSLPSRGWRRYVSRPAARVGARRAR